MRLELKKLPIAHEAKNQNKLRIVRNTVNGERNAPVHYLWNCVVLKRMISVHRLCQDVQTGRRSVF